MTKLIAKWNQAASDITERLQWSGPLAMRLFFGYFWLETGWAKLHNLNDAISRFVEWGIPFPSFNAPLSAGVEFIGGLLLMVGLFTRITSLAMLFNMVIAISLVLIKTVHNFDEFVELNEFVDILIFFWLIIAGPGTASLDSLLKRRMRVTVRNRPAVGYR